MKNAPDDIYRRKLEHLQTPPPARAWEQIEKGMRRKRFTPWLAIAAALLVIITASAVIWTGQTDNDTPGIADRQLPESQDTPIESDRNETVSPPLPDTSADAVENGPVHQAQQVPADAQVEISGGTAAAGARQDAPDAPSASERDLDVGDFHATEETIPTHIATAPDQDDTTPVKIILEADEVQAKYLKRKTADDATGAVAKTSGLKKLLDKADHLQDQDPIGDLRQMKNEILALNFQSKKRDQHK